MYHEGPLDQQHGWEVVQGQAEIKPGPYGNVQLEIPAAGESRTHARWEMEAPYDNELVTVSLEMSMAWSDGDTISPVARVFGVMVGRKNWAAGEDYSRLFLSYNDGEWLEIEGVKSYSVTLRFDRRGGRSVFDLRSGFSNYLLVNRPIPEGDFPAIELLGHPERSSYIDSIRISTARGLITSDQDDDGLHDGWEENFGLSTEEDNRDGGLEGDGVTNIEEYFYGSDPDAEDSDFDRVSDLDEILAGGDPSRGRWLGLGDGRIPYEPRDEDVVSRSYFTLRPPEGLSAPLEQRIAVLDAIQSYYSQEDPRVGRTATFDEFLDRFPESPYRSWLDGVVADWHVEDGDLLLAKPLLERAWAEMSQRDQRSRWDLNTFTTVAIYLASIYAFDGQFDEVGAIMLLVPNRSIRPALSQWYWNLQIALEEGEDGNVNGARTWLNPVWLLLDALEVDSDVANQIVEGPLPLEGVSLFEIKERAAALGVPLNVAYRESGNEIVTPTVSLNLLGYFTYIDYDALGQQYRFFRPFAADMWPLNTETLARESSGYFLISADAELPEGWRLAHDAEAAGQIGDRRTAPTPRVVNVRLKFIIPRGIFDESAMLEIEGEPGDYILQWSRELSLWSDLVGFALTEDAPVLRMTIEDVRSLSNEEQGFFKVR